MESNCCGALPLWETDVCSDCKEHAEFFNCEDKANERIKIIAQNGNDGLHYTKEKIKELWGQVKVLKR